MPMLETPIELAEQLADWLGVYEAPGGCDHGDGRSIEAKVDAKELQCRVCFVAGMTQRIRDAVRNEQLLASMPIDGAAS